MLATALATLTSWALRSQIDLADVAMIHLVAIAAAATLGRAPSITAALSSVAAFDFFFVPPIFTFHVEQMRHVVTFGVMLIAGISIATMTDRLRRQSEDRARLAAEARSARVQAETEELRSSLLSAVSHDLRTPLAVITGATTSLLEEGHHLDEAARRDLLRSVTEEAARIERLVGNVLEMSRLESGVAHAAREWVPVEEIVGSALTRLEDRLVGRAVTTRLPEEPWRVAVDPVLFEQVFVNLIDNAAKHTPAGTPIDVEVRSAGESIVFEVSDRGEGIAPGDMSRLFEKFHRGQSAASGSGLGLAICRAIVRAHGGTIEALAREGGGTVMRVVLPSFDAGAGLLAESEARAQASDVEAHDVSRASTTAELR